MKDFQELPCFKHENGSPYQMGAEIGRGQWTVRRARKKHREGGQEKNQEKGQTKRRIKRKEAWPYAQKTIKLDNDMTATDMQACRRQFLDEAKILRHAQHHHVVKFIDAFEIEDKVCLAIVMECAESNITDFVTGKKRDEKDLKRMGAWFGCLASVMDYIHGIGISHRDIKPENILLRQDKVLLADFGISRMGIIQTLSTTVPGWPRSRTSAYCAPEVEHGSSRGRSADIFSLGAVFLEILLARTGGTSKLAEKLTRRDGQKSYAKNVDRVQALMEDELRKLGEVEADTTEDYNSKMLRLCQEMLHRNRELRPDAFGVLTKLESFARSRSGCLSSPFESCTCHSASDTKNSNPDPQILQWCKLGSTKDVSNLLRNGVNPSTVGALHQAAARGHEDIVKTLVQEGASVDLRDYSMDTALHCAAGSGNLNIATYLLKKDADATLKNLEGRTALFYAAGRGELDVMELLLDKTSTVDLKTWDKYGQTALHAAARRGHKKSVNILLERLSDLDSKELVCHGDDQGRTALHLAAGYGSKSVVRQLLKHESNPNKVDKEGWTALHFAARGTNDSGKYRKVVKLLLEAGADATACDHNGSLVFTVAAAGKLRELLEDAYFNQRQAKKQGGK